MQSRRVPSSPITAAPDVSEPRALFRYVAEGGATGYTTAATRLVQAVRGLGVPVELRGWSDWRAGVPGHLTDHEYDGREAERPAAPGAPTVMHLVPEHLPGVSACVDGPVIVHTVWETDRIPDHWPGLCNRADGVIVPTAWNRDAFVACGVRVPIEVVPHVACDPVPGARSAGLGFDDDTIVFYTIARWDERKVPALTVRAFLRAFTADDPVVLVVKTGAYSEVRPPEGWASSSPMAFATAMQVAHLMRDFPNPANVCLEVGDWPDDRIAGLHHRGDCFVTLTHGEGWGIGSFDACAYGNPVVATGWSGHLTYLDRCASLVEYDLLPVEHRDPLSYSPPQRWAAARLEHAVELLRGVAADPAAARLAATPLRDRVLRDYAAPVVAQQFLDALGRLLAR